MNKVIILGGSFDPVHKGHILILKEAMKELNINEKSCYFRWLI